MWLLIQNAVFNNINKDLEGKLDKEEIEGRAADITISIMRSIKNKRAAGKPWMIKKVSSAVHLPCLARYDKKLQFYDKCMGQDAFTYVNEDGMETLMESEDSAMIDGCLCLSGIYTVPNYLEKTGISKEDHKARYEIVNKKEEQ